jgi:hypothetical protein
VLAAIGKTPPDNLAHRPSHRILNGLNVYEPVSLPKEVVFDAGASSLDSISEFFGAPESASKSNWLLVEGPKVIGDGRWIASEEPRENCNKRR